MKFPSVGLPKDLKHCSEVIRGVHIQCDGIELEFVKEPAVAAGPHSGGAVSVFKWFETDGLISQRRDWLIGFKV